MFSSLPVNTWEQILRQCIAFIKDCQQEKAPNDCNSNRLVELFGDKTQVRLNDYCNSQNISMSTQWIFNGEEKYL